MARLLLCLEPVTEDRLLAQILAGGHEVLGRPSSAAELRAATAALAPDAVLVAASPRHLTEAVLAACDDAGSRLVALTTGVADERAATALGLFDTVPADAPWPQIEAVVLGAGSDQHQEPELPAASSRGTVIAVWGPAGAPGRTTTAIGIAAELAARGSRVALADADSYGGTVAPYLGLLDEAPGFAAACRLAASGGLTVGELDRLAQQYPSGRDSFRVLTGIARPGRWPELSEERVGRTLSVCRSWVETTVVDVGFSLETDEEISSDLFAPRRNAATLAALRAADVVLAVGAADPVSLARLLRAHVELVETVDSARIEVLINRVRGGVVGLNPAAQIGATLLRFGGIIAPALVPDDAPSYDAALLSARTVRDAAPKSAAVAALRRFVDSRLLPAEPQPAPVRSRRPRLGRRLAAG